MAQIDKLKIVKILTGIYSHPSEEIPGWHFVSREQSKEDWKNFSPQEKQQKRLSYLENIIKSDEPSRLIFYYERMIRIYDLVLDRINRIEKLIGNKELEKVEPGLLRLYAIFLFEKDYMDEAILPNKHLGVNISRIAKEFTRTYPELELAEFAEAYIEMFKHWPGIPTAPIKSALEMNEKEMLYDTLISRFNKTIISTGFDEKTSSERNVALNKYCNEEWKSFDPYKRQDDRRFFINIGKKNKDATPESRKYYEKMVSTYDLMIDLLEKIKGLLPDEKAIKNAETGLLRLVSIILIAKDYMDEDILPKHHLQVNFIETVAAEMHETYPNLKLPELAKSYAEMYELWPHRLN